MFLECFWNVFGSVTMVSKENGFHGNLVTNYKQNVIRPKAEFKNLKKIIEDIVP